MNRHDVWLRQAQNDLEWAGHSIAAGHEIHRLMAERMAGTEA